MTHRRTRIRRLVRLLAWVTGVVLLLVVIIGATTVFLVSRPFPDYRGRVIVSGITDSVEILRDEYGVPHIYAGTLNDLAYGQGYAHAQDRFWQMEFWRRIGAGRLAEILGEELIATDRYLRTLGFARVAAEEYRRLPDPERAWLKSYAAGVNAYIESRPPRRLGLEFALLGLTGVRWEIDPWEPVDTLTWAKIMAQDLSKNLDTELRNLGAILDGGRPLARLLRPPYPESHPVIVSRDELRSFRDQLGIATVSADGPIASYRTAGSGVGSNSWVIAPELTATGGALLANDMHLGVQMPSIWYEVGLHLTAGDLSLRGYSFPGVPGVVAGQNDHIAWGITNLGGDVQDLFLEEIDPENRDRYRDHGTWLETEQRVERIYVAGRDRPVDHVVRRTIRGPIISDLDGYSSWRNVEIDPDRPAGFDRASPTALSLSWTALEPGTIVQAMYALNQATDYAEFRAALRMWDVPGQNFVYADRDGTIAYQSTGAHPIRRNHIGQFPALAAYGEGWSGQIPFDALPGALNPDKGYIATANNPVVDSSYAYLLGIDFANGYRARRISDMIENSADPIDAERIEEIHGDTFSLFAADVLPAVNTVTVDDAVAAWNAWWSGVDHPIEHEVERDPEVEREMITDVLSLLSEWDRRFTPESSGAVAFAYVWQQLISQTLADELPPSSWAPISVADSQTILLELLSDPSHAVWDDRTTEAVETRDAILPRAVAAAALIAAEDLGDDVRSWRWGDVHTVTFRNQSLGASGIRPVEALLNRGAFPAPGGPGTVNVAHWDITDPFDVTIIASQRAIYDLADPSRSRFIHPTGQSGHPFHRHYDDFIEPWLNSEYHPANWEREAVEAAAGRRRIVLRPGR